MVEVLIQMYLFINKTKLEIRKKINGNLYKQKNT